MPALPPLATAADLVSYGYDPLPAEALARASARVRRYTGQRISFSQSTVVLEGAGPWKLPQRPVTEILSCRDADDNEVEFVLHGATLRTVDACAPLTVTYEHGYEQVPDAIVELVCAVASRISSTPAKVVAGTRSEQIGGVAVTYGVEAARGTSGLTSAEEADLDRLFPSRRVHLPARLL